MKHAALIAVMALAPAGAASAQDYRPVTDQSEFLDLIAGKNLTNRLYGVNLAVSPNGTISGKGAGWDITGTWSWQDGYFCREMEWGGDPIPYNCQLVEVAGSDMRFTVDQGAGDSASFRLR
jgi:opacity protein-like surface antigen